MYAKYSQGKREGKRETGSDGRSRDVGMSYPLDVFI